MAAVTAGIPQVQSDTLGLASQTQVVGGTANTVLQFPDATVSGGGNVPNLAAVDVLDVRAVAEAARPPCPMRCKRTSSCNLCMSVLLAAITSRSADALTPVR